MSHVAPVCFPSPPRDVASGMPPWSAPLILPGGQHVPAWAVAPPVPSPHAAGLARGMPPQQGAWAPVVPPPAVAAPAESAKIEVGATVEVVEAFKSNSKGDRATLEVGQKGTVVKVDEDGDAFIKFDDHKDKEWVVRANFHKLRFVTDHAEETREAPDTEKRRTRGVALQPAAALSPRGPPQQLMPPVQASPFQKQMESRVAALQAHAAVMDMHHAMLQAERDRVASMQQQVIQSKVRLTEDIQALQAEIEKQKAVAPTAEKPGALSFDSQTSTSAGSPSLMDDFESMKEGATITVLEDFKSSSKGAKVQLTVGQKGVVCRVDGDGDVLVQFRDHPDKEWITRNNFDKLRVSRARKVPMAEGPTVTEVSDSGVMCRC
mmetsp:Transcript_75938/g.198043  ORF Transcript_75938/g.198043 Transcript_75938/m.198043 type:complete len:377 (-) Transcript_75938:507-1637(-)